MPIEIPVAKVDRKGRIICPVCGDTGEIPRDRWLSAGKMVCANVHAFMITADVAIQVNEILARTREGNWRGDILKQHEDMPAGPVKDKVLPDSPDGRVTLP